MRDCLRVDGPSSDRDRRYMVPKELLATLLGQIAPIITISEVLRKLNLRTQVVSPSVLSAFNVFR